MRCQSLRELVVLFDTQLQQLTLAYLGTGFFPVHTLLVAFSSLVVSAALAVATRGGAAAAGASPLLFTSFTSFAATVLATLMALTLLFRLTGGRFAHSPRASAYVVDWLLDAVCRPVTDDLVRVLLSPTARRERGIFFLALCVVGEAGKLLSFWSACTAASLAWCGWSAWRVWQQHRERACCV